MCHKACSFIINFKRAAAFQFQSPSNLNPVISLTGPSAVPCHSIENRAKARHRAKAPAAFLRIMVNHHYPEPNCDAGRSRPAGPLPLAPVALVH